MKRTKQLSIALLVCLVLVLAYQLIDLNRLNQNRTALKDRIAASTGTLALLSAPSADNSSRLAEVNAAYQSALNGVSQKVVTTQVIQMLLDITDRYAFQVNPITTEQWSKRNVGSTVYQVLPVNFSLNGNLNDIISFTRELENSTQYPNLEIESTRIVPNNVDNLSAGAYDTNMQIRILVFERLTTTE